MLYVKRGDRVTDANGNTATAAYWGTLHDAKKSLKTLTNCVNCVNCKDSTDCKNCTDCWNCENCTNCPDCWHCVDCLDCTKCTDCTNCAHCFRCGDCVNCTHCNFCRDCTSPKYVGPFRSDGYQFVMNSDGGIRAGCRVFHTMEEARKHWKRTRGGTPLGDETMKILDFLENVTKD